MPEWILAVARSILAYASLLILTRLLEKKQISQLTMFDYVVGITIGSMASTMSIEMDNQVLPAVAGVVVWSGLHILFCILRLKSPKWSKLWDGEPTVIVQNGRILEQNLSRELYTIDDLKMHLRLQKAFNLADVEFAVLERNGQLSVLKRSQYEPISPSDLSLPTTYKGLPTELVHSGKINHENLSQVRLSEDWLSGELQKLGIYGTANVFYAELDTEGRLYVNQYQDRTSAEAQVVH